MKAVLLEEAGVACRVLEDATGRPFVEADALFGCGPLERSLRGQRIEPVNDPELEQPLGILLRFASQLWELWQSGTHQGERQGPL